jgi:hypothetical protein
MANKLHLGVAILSATIVAGTSGAASAQPAQKPIPDPSVVSANPDPSVVPATPPKHHLTGSLPPIHDPDVVLPPHPPAPGSAPTIRDPGVVHAAPAVSGAKPTPPPVDPTGHPGRQKLAQAAPAIHDPAVAHPSLPPTAEESRVAIPDPTVVKAKPAAPAKKSRGHHKPKSTAKQPAKT